MKDSGIEWVGKVPKIWSLKPIRALFDEVTEKNFLGTCSNALKFTYGSIVRKPNFDADADDYVASTILNYTVVEPGTIMLNGLNLNFDFVSQRIGLVKEKGVITSAYMAFKPNEKQLIDSEFATYLFKAYDGCKAFHNMGGGVRKILNFNEFKKYYIPLPDLNEQQHIVDLLDTQCSEIDATAEDIQKEISLLEDYKKSVITEAVTKGLNPDVEMKDSGIEWIGEIPINWQAVNPRWLFAQRKDRAKKGMEQYTASQKYGVISQKDYMNRIGGSIVTVQKDFDILKTVCKGDFVIHMRSFQGGLEYSEHTGSISSAYVMLIPQKNAGECRYFKWLFKSASYINALQSTSNLIRDGQAMRYSNFIQIIIPYPPLVEQQQIADFLDSKCSEIDSLIADKKRQLDILADYKKSLIYEYVTGKKEVI